MLSVTASTGRFPDESLVNEWRGLLRTAGFATPFHTPAWVRAWLSLFGEHKSPLWLAVREGCELVGFFGLYATSGAWRTVRPIGCGQSDYLNPLSLAGREGEVCEALREHLSHLRHVDLVDLQQQRANYSFSTSDGETIDQATCLVLDLPSSYDDYLKTLSKSLRFDCRRMDKPPFSTGAAKLSPAEPGEARAVISSFFRLHARRWHRRGLPGSFATRQLRAFHEEVAVQLERDGYLRLTVLEVEGETVGVLYGMQVGTTRFFYQCGFDPEYKALSPGTLLVASSIKCAIEEGCTRFDFLRGDEAYKRRWNPQHSIRNLRYILPLNSGLGTVGRAINHAGSKIEEKIRARLEGRGLF